MELKNEAVKRPERRGERGCLLEWFWLRIDQPSWLVKIEGLIYLLTRYQISKLWCGSCRGRSLVMRRSDFLGDLNKFIFNTAYRRVEVGNLIIRKNSLTVDSRLYGVKDQFIP